jgi:hypothetical protein
MHIDEKTGMVLLNDECHDCMAGAPSDDEELPEKLAEILAELDTKNYDMRFLNMTWENSMPDGSENFFELLQNAYWQQGDTEAPLFEYLKSMPDIREDGARDFMETLEGKIPEVLWK